MNMLWVSGLTETPSQEDWLCKVHYPNSGCMKNFSVLIMWFHYKRLYKLFELALVVTVIGWLLGKGFL